MVYGILCYIPCHAGWRMRGQLIIKKKKYIYVNMTPLAPEKIQEVEIEN